VPPDNPRFFSSGNKAKAELDLGNVRLSPYFYLPGSFNKKSSPPGSDEEAAPVIDSRDRLGRARPGTPNALQQVLAELDRVYGPLPPIAQCNPNLSPQELAQCMRAVQVQQIERTGLIVRSRYGQGAPDPFRPGATITARAGGWTVSGEAAYTTNGLFTSDPTTISSPRYELRAGKGRFAGGVQAGETTAFGPYYGAFGSVSWGPSSPPPVHADAKQVVYRPLQEWEVSYALVADAPVAPVPAVQPWPWNDPGRRLRATSRDKTEQRTDTTQRYLYFLNSSTRIDKQGSRTELEQLKQDIAHGFEVAHIEAYTSPEGPSAPHGRFMGNVALAQRRARAAAGVVLRISPTALPAGVKATVAQVQDEHELYGRGDDGAELHGVDLETEVIRSFQIEEAETRHRTDRLQEQLAAAGDWHKQAELIYPLLRRAVITLTRTVPVTRAVGSFEPFSVPVPNKPVAGASNVPLAVKVAAELFFAGR
jgi:hypothetical protein